MKMYAYAHSFVKNAWLSESFVDDEISVHSRALGKAGWFCCASRKVIRLEGLVCLCLFDEWRNKIPEPQVFLKSALVFKGYIWEAFVYFHIVLSLWDKQT